MKPLYWARIQIQQQNGCNSKDILWNNLDDVCIESSEIENLFGKAPSRPKERPKLEEEKPSGKVERVKIIDGKKAQNVGIFLKSNKVDIDLVKSIVYNCESFLEKESLMVLKDFQATEDDELVKLKMHMEMCPEKVLDIPDQFLWELHKLNNFDSRMSCLIFQTSFASMCDEIESRLNNIKSCCNFLSTSIGLRKLLSVVLGRFDMKF